MKTATVRPDLVPIKDSSFRGELGYFLTIDCPNGWDDVKKVCKKVLEFENRRYIFTGWNSDRNEAFFRSGFGAKYAKIVKK